MIKKRQKKGKATATPKARPGYKGHREGSAAEKAHKLVDENPNSDRKVLVPKIVKLGVSDVTAGHWVSVFRKKKKEGASSTANKKAVPKKKTAPVKPKIAAKTSPVVKKKAEAGATATTVKPKKDITEATENTQEIAA